MEYILSTLIESELERKKSMKGSASERQHQQQHHETSPTSTTSRMEEDRNLDDLDYKWIEEIDDSREVNFPTALLWARVMFIQRFTIPVLTSMIIKCPALLVEPVMQQGDLGHIDVQGGGGIPLGKRMSVKVRQIAKQVKVPFHPPTTLSFPLSSAASSSTSSSTPSSIEQASTMGTSRAAATDSSSSPSTSGTFFFIVNSF
tara:strand:+ start:553 stop:1158 length:606 start_codon:yes stop_codon:yes gene_type:complete